MQHYDKLLIHLDVFEAIKLNSCKTKNTLRLQEIYYREVLDYLYAKYRLFLLAKNNIETYVIIEYLRMAKYFQNIYEPADKEFSCKDFLSIMQNIHCSDCTKYLVIGKNIDAELSHASRVGMDTCLLNIAGINNPIYSTYEIPAIEKIKTIV